LCLSFIKDETLVSSCCSHLKISAKEAFNFKENSITYKELDEWSSQIALYLQTHVKTW
jgi:hypothetical protein